MKNYYIAKGDELVAVLYIPVGTRSDNIIPNGIKTIGSKCFTFTTGLSHLIIPEGVEIIKEGAFYGNKELSSVSIPSSVRIIEDGAFANCKKLQRVQYKKSTNFGHSCFSGCCNLKKIYDSETEATCFYFANPNRFAIAIPYPEIKNEDYDVFVGRFASEDFPVGEPDFTLKPLYFLQTRKNNFWYSDQLEECILAGKYLDSEKSYSDYFHKYITINDKISPLDISFLTGICYKGRSYWISLYGGDENTLYDVSVVLSRLERFAPKVYERLKQALELQRVYNPTLTIDTGISLKDFTI